VIVVALFRSSTCLALGVALGVVLRQLPTLLARGVALVSVLKFDVL
jgi:hypothetical protein